MRILMTANENSFFIKFLIPQLKYYKDLGYEIHVASKEDGNEIPYCDKKFNVDFARGLNIKSNLKSYKQMKKIIENNKYDLISCHTPFGGFITRLATKKIKNKNTKIIYTAHGFHFYKGAPLINWILFYNAEKYMAKYTDTIITINKEDYELAHKKFKKTKVQYVEGIGFLSDRFDFEMDKQERKKYRKDLGIKENDFVIIYPAELLNRKRQEWLIKSLKDILLINKDIHVLLPGKDSMNGKLQVLAKKLNIDKNIHFLGFRKDVPKLLKISNLAVSTSIQEGLPVNVMEALYIGLPVVVTECRGNRDLVEDGINGYIVDKNNMLEFKNKVMKFYEDFKIGKTYEIDNSSIKKYSIDNVLNKIIEIYEKG